MDAKPRAAAIRGAAGAPADEVILLDTNALVWLAHGHRRTASLAAGPRRPYVSPASLLELQLLVEAGRVRLRTASLTDLADDGRWTVDDPSSAAWFQQAWSLTWTRDPFDRLLVAHARLRGWKLATADEYLLDHLDPAETVPL